MTRSWTKLYKPVGPSVLMLAALGGIGWQPVAAADPAPYGPNTCIQGYVWRLASPQDLVCVIPRVRDRTAQENQLAGSRRNPNGGPYGPDTCLQGYVWRDAFNGDHVCVSPDIRTATADDNALAASRLASLPAPSPHQGPPPQQAPH